MRRPLVAMLPWIVVVAFALTSALPGLAAARGAGQADLMVVELAAAAGEAVTYAFEPLAPAATPTP